MRGVIWSPQGRAGSKEPWRWSHREFSQASALLPPAPSEWRECQMEAQSERSFKAKSHPEAWR